MDFSSIDKFKETYWTYENIIIDHILFTGKRFPITREELEYNEILKDLLTHLKHNISIQLSQDSNRAPILLVYIQEFLNEVYNQREMLRHSEQISFVRMNSFHSSITKLQSFIVSLAKAYKVELNIYEPSISTNEALTDKEMLLRQLFPEERNRKKALAVIDQFSLSEKPKIWQLSGFLLVMNDQKIINQKISTVEQEKLTRNYFLGEFKRINNNSSKAYSFSEDISSFLKEI